MAQPQQMAMPGFQEIVMGILVLCLILMIIMPLPHFLIDLSICMNIVLGVTMLMMSLYVRKPLEMASFPSLLLVSTMFRLALGIATTRAILAEGECGAMVEAFGHFVTGGNLIVGTIIFVIITIVNFMVITKGSERIAEVEARFALDSMPGKQMSIDADLNSGLISPDVAIHRREELQREMALGGAMDGAMKFVKGDAIAGIIITVINIIGGLGVGVLMKGMEPMDALNHYAILTIGDGLTQQLPALMLSVSTGITMTRSTSLSDNLGKDLYTQFQGKPYALFFSAGFLLLVAASAPITGLPWYVFLLFAVGVAAIGFSVLLKNDVQQQLGQLEAVKQNMAQLIDPNRMYEKMGVDPLSLQVGSNLLKIADPEQDGQLLGKIAGLRARLTDELGFILPNIRIMDSLSLGPYEYLISIRGNPVAQGNVYPDYYMILGSIYEAVGQRPPQGAVKDRDPTYGTEAYWVQPQEISPEVQNHAVDATDAIIAHLQEISVKYVDEVMTKMDVLKLMEFVRQHDPSLIQELVPAILTPNDLRKIFVNLIREKVSIKDVQFLFERMSDYARFSKEPDVLSERLRAALGRQICLAHCDPTKTMYAVTLSNEWEKILDDSCQRTELGTMFLLNPIQVQELIEITSDTLRSIQQSYDRMPVILCSPRIRLPLYQLLDRHIPMVSVLSYSELIPDIQVQAVGTIGTADGY
jgi:flagellar biosynthesis protein FlhA